MTKNNKLQTSFFKDKEIIYLVVSATEITEADSNKLSWALSAERLGMHAIKGKFIGPRPEMITPWSTNAVEIAENMAIDSLIRIEQFREVKQEDVLYHDPMLEAVYEGLDQESLMIRGEAEADRLITDIRKENEVAGLALSEEEIVYLENAAKTLSRELTDVEVYGFGQINSEHCRHKIFNGKFVVSGVAKEKSLFRLIKDTAANNSKYLVSAYKDNVAFVTGGKIKQFSPRTQDKPDLFSEKEIDSVISIKAETHNFPTTVEPFYGASTGSGGEIRDRMAGGIGSIPLVGTAVYMTAYSRMPNAQAQNWERLTKPRNWKYQTPAQILIKASNGASDFGNKFGQPLIVGSLFTYEQKTSRAFYGFDRVIMLAGGVGYANAEHAKKLPAAVGDKVVLLGGDNYRIGMAGGSVSSVDTGKLNQQLELNAVQRANPEMQKRVFNVIRALAESSDNPIKLIHDHGAGGHMNCFSELLDELGGRIDIYELPVGDPTLSTKEILCNESQERMGLIVPESAIPLLRKLAERERAPMYVVGEVTGEKKLEFVRRDKSKAVDLPLEVLFGSAPKTILEDAEVELDLEEVEFSITSGKDLIEAIHDVLSLEAVACKDWLTNKVDRSVTGRIALQQTTGPLQLPLNNLGVVSLDFQGSSGIATAIGHAPVAAIIDAKVGSELSVLESLTNIIWAPIKNGLESVALSANWMWPAKQKGENARLYQAVEALSEFAKSLNLAVPTGKDSLSMTMNYADGAVVRAPGTVIVTAAAECDDIRSCLTPDLKHEQNSKLIYIDLTASRENPLGATAFAQTLGQLGKNLPNIKDHELIKRIFSTVQNMIREKLLLAGHDVSSGGLISTILEMAFTGDIGFELKVAGWEKEVVRKLFSEKPGLVLQVSTSQITKVEEKLSANNIPFEVIGEVRGTQFKLHSGDINVAEPISNLRRVWFKPSYLLDQKQSNIIRAKDRFETFDRHPLHYKFPLNFSGSYQALGINKSRNSESGIRAAIVRDKGTNGERELAYALHLAGFDVLDVTMNDLISGRENLESVNFLAYPGGFSNSDVLGSAKGWAGAFKYNQKAFQALEKFYSRKNTMSVGVCNGCQLIMALELIYPEDKLHPTMNHNDSGKFESTFVGVKVQETKNIMLQPLIGTELGIWVAHGEGRFSFDEAEEKYDIPVKFVSADYPANPNGSQFNAAAVSSRDGRHLAIMPHLERSLFSWNWPHREGFKPDDELSPWMLAFQAAYRWVSK